MEDDRIRVDEPLISTDVDNLIRVISEKKKISLGRLRSVCKMDRQTLDKWVGVLEDEGYISVVYGITGTYVVWSGKPTDGVPTPKPEAAVEKKEKKPLFSFFSKEESKPSEDPEDKLSQYLEKKREEPEFIDDSVKESILESLADEVEEEKEEPDLSYIADVPEVPDGEETYEEPDGIREVMKELQEEPEHPEEPAEDEPSEGDEAEPVPLEEKEAEEPLAVEEDEVDVFGTHEDIPGEPVPEEPVSPQPDSTAIKDLVDAYVSEVRKEREKLTELRKRQHELYREKMAPLEEQMETDIVAITERIMGLQARLHELKDGVLELPDKVEGADKLQDEISNLGKEARAALVRTREHSDSLIKTIKKSQDEVHSKIDEGRASLKGEERMVEELERASSSLESRSEKIRNVLEGLKVQMSEIDNTMKDLLENLQEAADMKNQVTGVVDEVKVIMGEQSRQLAGFEEELVEVENMERWVMEYVDDYERKIGNIEKYVGRSDDDLRELRAAAEAKYMTRYLTHLEDMTKSYNTELGTALDANMDIEEQVSATKERIAELLKESQDMVEKLRSETADAKDFLQVASEKRKKARKVKNLVEEKGKERERLRQDIKQKKRKKKSSKKKKK